MAKDVRQWRRSCVVCGGRKLAPVCPRHLLQQDPVAEPLQRKAIDILGLLLHLVETNTRSSRISDKMERKPTRCQIKLQKQ